MELLLNWQKNILNDFFCGPGAFLNIISPDISIIFGVISGYYTCG